MPRARQLTPSSESSEGYGTAQSDPSTAPSVPTPTRGMRTRRSRTTSPEQVTSSFDPGPSMLGSNASYMLGSAVERLLRGDEHIPRRQRERVETELRDKQGKLIPKDELRKIRRRKTNRESAARTRQFRAMDKQQLRDEVHELLRANIEVTGKLQEAQHRIDSVSDELERAKAKYDRAERDRGCLMQRLPSQPMAAPVMDLASPTSSTTTTLWGAAFSAGASPESVIGHWQLPLAQQPAQPRDMGMPRPEQDLLASWNAAHDLLPPTLPAMAPAEPARLLPEMPQLVMPSFAQEAAYLDTVQLDAALELSRCLPDTVSALTTVDDLLGSALF